MWKFSPAFFKRRRRSNARSRSAEQWSDLSTLCVAWSPPQRRNLPHSGLVELYSSPVACAAFLFCQARKRRLRLRLSEARQFSFVPPVSKKKADKKFKFALFHKGNPPLVRFPSFRLWRKFTPLWRFGRIREFRACERDRRSRRLRQAFEKA